VEQIQRMSSPRAFAAISSLWRSGSTHLSESAFPRRGPPPSFANNSWVFRSSIHRRWLCAPVRALLNSPFLSGFHVAFHFIPAPKRIALHLFPEYKGWFSLQKNYARISCIRNLSAESPMMVVLLPQPFILLSSTFHPYGAQAPLTVIS
jgi:hypothetical protein